MPRTDSPPRRRPRANRRNLITLDLPPEQVAWLDRRAAATDRSRSAFARTLIAAAMDAADDTNTAA